MITLPRIYQSINVILFGVENHLVFQEKLLFRNLNIGSNAYIHMDTL